MEILFDQNKIEAQLLSHSDRVFKLLSRYRAHDPSRFLGLFAKDMMNGQAERFAKCVELINEMNEENFNSKLNKIKSTLTKGRRVSDDKNVFHYEKNLSLSRKYVESLVTDDALEFNPKKELLKARFSDLLNMSAKAYGLKNLHKDHPTIITFYCLGLLEHFDFLYPESKDAREVLKNFFHDDAYFGKQNIHYSSFFTRPNKHTSWFSDLRADYLDELTNKNKIFYALPNRLKICPSDHNKKRELIKHNARSFVQLNDVEFEFTISTAQWD